MDTNKENDSEPAIRHNARSIKGNRETVRETKMNENEMKKNVKETRDAAVVTGAGRGIGRAIAVKLAEKGCDVVINYSSGKTAADETAKLCEERGAKTVIVQGNVAEPEDCSRIIDAAKEAFGRIDILVNNAGITRDNILMRMTEKDFQDVIDVDMTGVFNMMKAAAPVMIRKRYGRIINIASVSGIMGNPGQTNYSAAKAGVIGMTKAYAREVASRNITVNAVAPGMVKTDMTDAMPEKAVQSMISQIPAGRIGTPQDIAGAVAFLADRDTSYITGHTICVDGGMCM
jgi:3-oxoacyl-[acyl-carrier protein] reductase